MRQIESILKRRVDTSPGAGALFRAAFRREKWRRVKRYRLLYLLFFLPALSLFIFHYIPIYGVVIAFKDYSVARGIFDSPWNNLAHFRQFFSSAYSGRILRNTVIISLLRMAFGFPAPIVFALLIDEIRHLAFKKVVQTISYLPHFFSWVVIAGILVEVLSPQRGFVGALYALFDRPAPNILINLRLFRPLLVASGIWKGVGWGTIVYLAAITAINPELYEAAAVDGARRFHCAWHITLPSLVPVMTILFILSLGGILNAGFDQIFNLYSPPVYEVADIIDTYVYRQALIRMKYGYGAAVGLFKNVIGLALVLGTNSVIKRFSEYGIW